MAGFYDPDLVGETNLGHVGLKPSRRARRQTPGCLLWLGFCRRRDAFVDYEFEGDSAAFVVCSPAPMKQSWFVSSMYRCW